jgi:hypothetical protein
MCGGAYVPRAVVPHGPQLRPNAPAGFFSAFLVSRLHIAFRGRTRALSKRTQSGLCRLDCALGKISAYIGEKRVQTLLYEAHLFRSRRIWVSTPSLSALRTLLIVNVFGLSGSFAIRAAGELHHGTPSYSDRSQMAGWHLIWHHSHLRLLTILSFICVQICAAAAVDNDI